MTTPHQPQPHTDGWQEIATAPKDGTVIDLFFAFMAASIAVEVTDRLRRQA